MTDAPIRAADIHSNVRYVCQRLRDEGHTTLLVGGAVRDMLLGRSPKDFDLATSARPETVKQLFRNARIIGRRFKLAQIRYPSMSIEVATFRGEARTPQRGVIRRDNRYGTSAEDAVRRDFTVNALGYDPLTHTLYDHVDGLADLRAHRIRTIKAPEQSFREDPVRMLRAVRFEVRLGFEIDPPCEAAIIRLAPLLGDVTRHRLGEEMQRFLTRGNAAPAYAEFERLGLLDPLLGMVPHAWLFAPEALERPLVILQPYLRRMDRWIEEGGETIPPTVALLGLLVTLGGGALRSYATADVAPGGARRGGGIDARLRKTLGEWGMLNGQVAPALGILAALRSLLQRREAALAVSAKAGQATGIREAALLAIVLQDVLGVSAELLAACERALPKLPDLPILDHPRPAGRSGGRQAESARRGSPRSGRRRRGGHSPRHAGSGAS